MRRTRVSFKSFGDLNNSVFTTRTHLKIFIFLMCRLYDIIFLCARYRHSERRETLQLVSIIDYMFELNVQFKPADVRPAGHMSLDTSDDACDLHNLQEV